MRPATRRSACLPSATTRSGSGSGPTRVLPMAASGSATSSRTGPTRGDSWRSGCSQPASPRSFTSDRPSIARVAAAGTVYLVGAGPGDPGLVTRRALELVREADAIVYDRLIPVGLVAEARPDAQLHYAGK